MYYNKRQVPGFHKIGKAPRAENLGSNVAPVMNQPLFHSFSLLSQK